MTDAAPAVDVPARGLTSPRILRWSLVAAAAATGIALRAWVYGSALGVPDSDEAVVGLMARHALHGELATFYWGQPYGGTQEVLLAAPLVAALGNSMLALRVVPMTLSAVGSLLLWRVGRRTVGEPAAGAAALLLWVWPPYMLVRVTGEFGFYGAELVYVTLLVLLALRIVERPDRLRVALFGLAFGLAFWESAQIIPIAAPVIAWTIVRAPRSVRHAWLGLLAAAAGAAPWLAWNLEHGWASILRHADARAYVHALRIFVSPLLPMALGLRSPLSAELLLSKPLTYLLYVGLLVLFAVTAVAAARRRVSIAYTVAAAFPFIWAFSRRVGVLTSSPMYLIVVAPIFALLLARLATTKPRAVALVGAAAAVSAVSIQRMNAWLELPAPHSPPTVPRSFAPLIETLDRVRLNHVYASYWIAYRLDFDSGERIVAAQNAMTRAQFEDGRVVLADDPNQRHKSYEREVGNARRRGVVMFRRDVAATPIVPQLRAHGYVRHDAGPFVVFAPPG